MRYAIVSDIHANWQAWSAVREDFLSAGVDAVVCLGDIVGYGPEPARVLRDLRSLCSNLVLGNHDAAMVGRIDVSRFRAAARRSAEWTRTQLDDHALSLFAATPLMMESEDALFVHAETPAPEDFGYVEEAEDALACFRAVDARFIFLGHTHVPGSFALGPDGRVEEDLRVEPGVASGGRLLVNVGSVGDPRDGTDRASYAIYDASTGRVELRQVAFDTDAYLAALKRHPVLELPLLFRRPAAGSGGRTADEAMTATKVSLVKVQRIANRPRIRVRRSSLAALAASGTAAADVPLRTPPPTSATPRRRRGRVIGLSVVAFLALAALAGGWWGHRARTPRAAEVPSAPAEPAEDAAAVERREQAREDVVHALSVLTLRADRAERYGKAFRLETMDGVSNIGYWSSPSDYLVWRFRPARSGVYEIEMNYAVPPTSAGSPVVLAAGRESLRFRTAATGGWSNYASAVVGRIRLNEGLAVLEMRPDGKPKGGLMNLRALTLRPVSE